MNINITDQLLEKYKEYIKLSQVNHLITTNIIENLGNLTCNDQQLFSKLMDNIAEDGEDLSENQKIILTTIMILQIKFTIPDDILGLVLGDLLKYGNVLEPQLLKENPYFKNIKLPEKTTGNFQLTYEKYNQYDTTMYNTTITTADGLYIPAFGVYKEDFYYPCIKENGKTWMSVTENEVNTLVQPIEDSAGNVLTLGCGMGYYAYMASQKPTVTSITIVEYSEDVINLFSQYILPQFPNKDKIKIVHADAIEYMKTVNDGDFDFCFADIWISCDHVLPYLKIKEICTKFEKMKISYWVEDGLTRHLSEFVLMLVGDKIKTLSEKKVVYDNFSNEQLEILEILNRLLENTEIKNPHDLENLILVNNLADVLGK